MTDDKKTAPADSAANSGLADILAFAPDGDTAMGDKATRADRHAATLALKHALPRRLTRSLKRRDAIVLFIQAPSAAWVGPLHDAARDLFGPGRSIDYSTSPRDSTHGDDLLYFARPEADARGRPDVSGGWHRARPGPAAGADARRRRRDGDDPAAGRPRSGARRPHDDRRSPLPAH
jgi:hypothetical protein